MVTNDFKIRIAQQFIKRVSKVQLYANGKWNEAEFTKKSYSSSKVEFNITCNALNNSSGTITSCRLIDELGQEVEVTSMSLAKQSGQGVLVILTINL